MTARGRGMRAVATWIPMSDGTRLASTLYMPDGPGDDERFPALLEYLPYRKDDGTLERDLDLYPYVVARGYVGARVDIRGTGASQGALPDREYSEQEQLDGMEVIAWLSAQAWCDGNVGMWGISWGGFNSIQIAMRKPPALKAIVALEASDDLFHDDVHYVDGMLHVDEYELFIDLENAMTPAPDLPVDDDALAPRFDSAPWLLTWLREQRDGPFWRRASLRPDYERLSVPALLIGGWLDGYRDSVPRMLEGLPSPTRAIVGPWNHAFPHDAVPGPAIEWRREAVAWWDRWLKGLDPGGPEEPVAVYIREWHPPDPGLTEVPGTWRSEDAWPPRDVREEVFVLQEDGSLGDGAVGRRSATSSAVHRLPYRPATGIEAGMWWGELTPDQRPVDQSSLVYDSLPLEQDVAILGLPRAELFSSVTAPLARWFARLSDVAPDGRVTLVTGAGVNGPHLESAEDPRPLEPGRVYVVPIEMHFTSWVFPRGHRVRLAISNALWPMAWPTPHSMTMSLHLGARHPSRLVLPILRLRRHEPGQAPSFLAPEPTPGPAGVRTEGSVFPGAWSVETAASGLVSADWHGETRTRFPWGRQRRRERLVYSVEDRRPALAGVRGGADVAWDLDGRRVVWRSELEVRSTANELLYAYRRELREQGRIIRERSWRETIPRDHQ